MFKLLVIIPAFNEEKTIVTVIKKIPDLTARDIETHVVVIDDCSTDKTKTLALSAGATVISHSRNQGMGGSIRTGLIYALENDADIAVSVDGDLQFDPEDIPLVIQPILDGKADFVAGDRFTGTDGKPSRPENMSKTKYWGNQRVTNLINWLTGTNMKDVSSGFRAYSRETLYNLNLNSKYTVSHETIMDLAFKGLHLESVPVTIRYFADRKSKVAGNLWVYIKNILRIITRVYRDYKPLRFFFYLGLPSMILGAAAAIFILIHFITTGDFTPYKFVGFIGAYLISLGLVLWIIGFLSDILVGIRSTQEKQLYYQKKQYYDKKRKD